MQPTAVRMLSSHQSLSPYQSTKSLQRDDVDLQNPLTRCYFVFSSGNGTSRQIWTWYEGAVNVLFRRDTNLIQLVQPAVGRTQSTSASVPSTTTHVTAANLNFKRYIHNEGRRKDDTILINLLVPLSVRIFAMRHPSLQPGSRFRHFHMFSHRPRVSILITYNARPRRAPPTRRRIKFRR